MSWFSNTLVIRMADDQNHSLSMWPDLIEKVRARTPARVLADRMGAAYRTAIQLQLRQDHVVKRGTELGAAILRGEWRVDDGVVLAALALGAGARK